MFGQFSKFRPRDSLGFGGQSRLLKQFIAKSIVHFPLPCPCVVMEEAPGSDGSPGSDFVFLDWLSQIQVLIGGVLLLSTCMF